MTSSEDLHVFSNLKRHLKDTVSFEGHSLHSFQNRLVVDCLRKVPSDELIREQRRIDDANNLGFQVCAVHCSRHY